MKNPFYSWLTPLLAVGVTLLGFFLLRPEEPGGLFWINLGYTICLEILFFVWLHWGRIKSRSVDEQTLYFRVFLGVGTLYYIIASVIWMIFFFLCGTSAGRQLLAIHFDLPDILSTWPEMTIRIYLFGILVLTVLWIVIASIVGRHDVKYNTMQTALENATEDVRSLAAELKDMAERYQTPQTQRDWKRLILEAESIPPAKVEAEGNRLRAKAEQLTNINTKE